MIIRYIKVFVPAIALTLLGCSSTQTVCAPGATQQCVCPGSVEGAQACNSDGSGWKTCQCGGAVTSNSSSSTTSPSGAGGGNGSGGGNNTGGTGGEQPATTLLGHYEGFSNDVTLPYQYEVSVEIDSHAGFTGVIYPLPPGPQLTWNLVGNARGLELTGTSNGQGGPMDLTMTFSVDSMNTTPQHHYYFVHEEMTSPGENSYLDFVSVTNGM